MRDRDHQTIDALAVEHLRDGDDAESCDVAVRDVASADSCPQSFGHTSIAGDEPIPPRAA